MKGFPIRASQELINRDCRIAKMYIIKKQKERERKKRENTFFIGDGGVYVYYHRLLLLATRDHSYIHNIH